MRFRPLNGATAAGALAAASLIGSSIAALALALPESGLAQAIGLAGSSEAVADRLSRSASSDITARAAAIEATRRTLAQAPASSTAWLRLAYLDSLSPTGLGREGNDALALSYVVAPYGPDNTAWRVIFALNHWRDVDISNRRRVLEELRHAARERPHVVRLARRSVIDPVGRLALALTVPAQG